MGAEAGQLKRHRGTALRVAISVTLLALLVRYGGVDPRAVAAALAAAQPGPIAAALVIYGAAGTLVRVVRWRVLIDALDHRISLARATEIFLIGVTFNQVLPTGIGGDVVRTLMLGRDGLGRARAASTVLVERTSGMLALLAVGLLMLGFGGQGLAPEARALLLAVGASGVLMALLLWQGRAARTQATRLPVVGVLAGHRAVSRFVDSFADYGVRAIGANFALSLVFAAVLIATNLLLGRAFGVSQAGLGEWALMVPLIALSLLVPSIGGLGVREWSYVGLLGALTPSVPADTATAVSLAFHGLNLILAAGGGVLIVWRGTGDVEPPLG